MMEEIYLLSAVIVFVYGLLIGSFLNVLIYRIPRGENIALSRSKCTFCEHPLSAWDLFPLFSYLFLGGKCRYCKKVISFRYPLIEALNALCYTAVYLTKGLNAVSVFFMLLSSLTIVIGFMIYDKGRKNED